MNQKNTNLTQKEGSINTLKSNKQSTIKFIKNLNEEQEMKFWIKTLLSSFSKIPEIIKTLDKIIELQASSISFISDIYNKEKSTYYQVEKVIDLTERKNNLLNIYIMTKKLTDSLSLKDSEFVENKFIHNWSAEELSKEYNISIRTVYRKVDKLLIEIFENAKRKNWSLGFVKSQIKNERWLKDKFFAQVSEYQKLTNQKIKI